MRYHTTDRKRTLWLGLGCGLLLAASVAVAGEPLSEEQLTAAIEDGCSRTHRIEYYEGLRDFEITGPLWLSKGRESVPRGVILPPYLRVYLYARGRGCARVDREEARRLAAPEVWVVVWRHEDPPNPPGQRRTSYDQKVLRPTEVRWRFDGSWHRATETRTRDSRVQAWFGLEWIERESLVAVFSRLEHGGALHVDYQVEEIGRSYLTDSEVFSLTLLPEKWWRIASGVAE